MTTARPRIAGLDALRRQSFRPFYEPFTPKVEEREENEAHILQLQLPDFNPQQVRVKVEEGTRTVAVAGDRYVGNNRWFRLDKTYPLPENCMIDKVYHKFQDGILTITMPKETSGQGTAEEAAAAAAPKEPEQPSPEKGREDISPENIGQGTAAAPPLKDPERPTPEKGREDISPENAARPEAKAETKGPEEALPKGDSNSVKPADNDKGKSAELQKQAPVEVKEEGPTQEAAAPKAEKGPEPEPKPVQGDSGELKTTQDQKMISSPDHKPTEKKEIENQNPEKGKEKEDAKAKESKTEEVGKNQEMPKVSIGTPLPRAIRASTLAGRFTVGRMPLPVTASLAAAVVTVVAAYFAYAYYGLLATK